MNKTLIITSLATCLVTGQVFAAQTGQYGSTAHTKSSAKANESPATHRMFIRLDANKDGYIERSEAQSNAALTQDFSKLSKNGKLSESEFSAWESQRGNASMTKTKHENMPMNSPTPGGGTK